jgi:hypothetical protein
MKSLEARESIRRGYIKAMWSQLCRQVQMAQRIPKNRIRRYEQAAAAEALTAYAKEFTTPPAKRKLETYLAYVALLDKLLAKLRHYRDTANETPHAVARGKQMTTSGGHWADWIPQDIKVKFMQALEDVHEYPEVSITAFPQMVYKVPPPSSRRKPKREKTPIELMREECKALDKDYLLDPTPEKKVILDAKLAAFEEAKKEVVRARSRAQYAQIKAEREAFKARLAED